MFMADSSSTVRMLFFSITVWLTTM